MGRAPESTMDRVFRITDHLQPADGEPIRSVVTETAMAVVVAWTVKPGQKISTHVHPAGQDTWTILSGCGDYVLDASGSARAIGPGDVAVAPAGSPHGVVNTGDAPLVFVSVVCPVEAGYMLV